MLKIEYFSIELSVPSYLIQHIILDGMFSMFAILWDAYIVKEILLFRYILMLKKTFIVKSASFIDNQAQLFHFLTIFEFLYNNRFYQLLEL